MGVDDMTAVAIAATTGAVGMATGYMMGGYGKAKETVAPVVDKENAAPPVETAAPEVTTGPRIIKIKKGGSPAAPADDAPAPAPVDGAIADSGNATEGAKLFKAKCATCHSVLENGPTKQGPNLWGIMGKEAAKSSGFTFTEKLKGSNIVWDNQTMFEWLTNPKAMVKGTTMAFPGFKKEHDRANVIAYLNSL